MDTQDREIMVGISPELYRKVEMAAAQKDLSIREYLEEALDQILSHSASSSEEQARPMIREAFEGLLQLRERFKKNHPGQVLDDSTEIIRQMREERSQYLADL